ncbi:MAG TPA: transposase [Alphaproteobacteria bacterium]|jgi:hypothetical protein|nr:transposase [Alphaproteobacteria bacterium]
MFRKRDPQGTLFASSTLVPEAKARRLRGSWAETFRARALPLIDEEVFAPLYCDDNGRPNRPVETVFGVLLLKDMFGLTDAEALEQLEYNLLWHHALELTPEEAHLPQKTLHNFRARMMAHDGGREGFEAMTDAIIEALDTKVTRQRLDSTHVISNIAVRTRLGLLCETVRVFLSVLKAEHPRLYARVPARLRRRYLKADGGDTAYDDARAAEGQRRLSVCARDLYRLYKLFAGTAAASLEAFALMQRVLDEQCDLTKKKQRPLDDDDDADESGVPVVVKAAKEVDSTSLQSPHDPDATYSKRKGKGYEVQVSETCHEDNVTQIITHVEVTDASASDVQATLPVLEALAARGQPLEEMVADTTYGSAENAVDAQRMDVELVSPVAGSPVPIEEEPSADRLLTGADFVIDAHAEDPAVCPGGHFSTAQHLRSAYSVMLSFDCVTCEACVLFHRCPAQLRSDEDAYVLTVDLSAANLERRRRAEANGEFKSRYAIRAGIEATNSELKRRHGLGHLRVRGRLRVTLSTYLKALACNVKRMVRALMPKPRELLPATT